MNSRSERTLPIPPLERDAAGPVVDTRRRGLRGPRISVTDRCNFRCTYCMPKDVFGADYQFLPHAELLTLRRVTARARARGASRIRRVARPY